MKESEARYRNLTRMAPVGIFHAGPDGAFRYVNRRWCRIAGLEPDEALGDGWARGVASAERSAVMKEWREAVGGGRSSSQEYSFRLPDGTLRQVYVRAEPERSEDGRVVGYVGTVVDVTELLEARREVSTRERELDIATRNLPITLARVDRDLRYRMARGDFWSWWGVSEREVPGRHVRDVVGPELYTRIEPFLMKALEGHRADFELEVPTPGGSRWMRAVLVPELDVEGEVEGYFSLVLDVTARKEEERARLRTERRYAAILDNSPDAILSADESGRILLFNKGAERVFGYEASEVIGRPLEILVPPGLRTAHREHVEEFARGPAMWRSMYDRGEISGRRKSGDTFPAEAVIGKVEDEGEWLVTAIVRDVTDRKRLEEQYLQSQKMEALGRLAGGVAHDFNNVLSSLMGKVELMRLGLSQSDPLRSDLDEVLEDCERAASLTRQLLVFSRQQVLEPRVVDVSSVVAGIESMLRRIIGEDVLLSIDAAADAGTVRIDPTQLEQILLNLSVNARDAMPKGGELSVSVREETVEPGSERASQGVESGAYVVLDVSDTGCGMDREVLSKIFEPFYTTKTVGKGTGLGLSTVFGIATRAGGHVTVHSEPGRGSRFTILLPRVGDAETSTSKEGDRGRGVGSETILVVEDDESVRSSIQALLARHGYEVLAAKDAEEAFELVRGTEASIDLLLSDIIMPRVGGRELARRLRAEYPGVKTLFMSGYAGDASQGEPLPQEHVLQKPFSVAELCSKVRSALDRREQELRTEV